MTHTRIHQRIRYSQFNELTFQTHIFETGDMIYDIIIIIHGDVFVSAHNNLMDATITFNMHKLSMRKVLHHTYNAACINGPAYITLCDPYD